MDGCFLKNITFALLLFLLPLPLFAEANTTAQTHKLEVLFNGELTAGKPATVTLIIRDIESGEAITLDNLQYHNKQRIHAWLIDPTFTNIQHIHPESTTTPYNFNFTFTPKISGSYIVWADISPLATQKQELLQGWIGTKDYAFNERIQSYTTAMNGYVFNLSFDVPPMVGQTSTVNLNVTDPQNKPVRWMVDDSARFGIAEYPSIVGFYDDNEHIITETQDISTRTSYDGYEGPDIKFKITPTQAGFVKTFVRIVINDKEMFIPFGIVIQNNNS